MKTKIILDTNSVVHYILDDIPAQAKAVELLLDEYQAVILPEVVCETIYSFCKFYNLPRDVAAKSLIDFLEDNDRSNPYILKALRVFRDTKFDMVDCLLFAYSRDCKVLTFDKKLNKLIERGDSFI